LDHIFQKQNDTLNFIYFASEYGFLRTYPRYQWPLDDKLRALDARRQSWYTQYTGVPKDVLFLVDTSGSMHGQALHLANTSLRLLIETLNKNDFFAVAKFPTNRTHLMPSLIYGRSINASCYNSFVQATSLNKQHVIQNVFRLTAHDAADYDEAIAFGMKLMSTFSAGRPMSAHCNKILVLISDSDIQYNDTTIQILERYQDYVHLFTYSLSTITGPGPLTEVTKQINVVTSDGKMTLTSNVAKRKRFLRQAVLRVSSYLPLLSTMVPAVSYVEGNVYDLATLKSADFSGPSIAIDFNAYTGSFEANATTPTFMDGSETTSRLFADGMQSGGSENVDSKFDVSQETNELMTENTSTLFSTEEPQDFVAGIQTAARITPQPRVVSLPKVTVFLGAQASQNGLTNTFAVAGLTLSETYLQEVLRRFPRCENGDTCYLLDDAAFVMAVNNERLNYQVGHFLGHVDPPLMESLLGNLVYSRVRYYDHQAVCDSAHLGEKNSTSSANNLFPNLVRGLCQLFCPNFWLSVLQKTLAIVIKLTNVLIIFSQMFINAFALDQGVDYVNCVKSTYRYYATDGANFRKEPFSSVEVTGSFSCSPECTRQWSSSSIPETNLKLIKTDPVCACIKKDHDWQLTPSIGMIN
uniref:VWFA domain-containing protein n=1 Tax=Taenia asiatica TaxID=60517 RepID=A0A158R789_TAEAS